MELTIGQTFDIVFDTGAHVDVRPGDRPPLTYESRRWFRRYLADPVLETTAQLGAVKADEALAARIQSRVGAWSAAGGHGRRRGGRRPPIDGVRHIPPRMPYDVFAVAAHIVEAAGIYQHLQGQKTGGKPEPLELLIAHEHRETVREAAGAWRRLPLPSSADATVANLLADDVWNSIEPLFESWWVLFAECAAIEIVDGKPKPKDLPSWWFHAWRLMAIADEAAKGTGFVFDVPAIQAGTVDLPWFEMELAYEHLLRGDPGGKAGPLLRGDPGGKAGAVRFHDIPSLSVARASTLAVLPKVRTPAVGCTLRSLSHHLALLPAAGIAQGRWTPSYSRPPATPGSLPNGVMNMLLVPLPYSIDAAAFHQTRVEDVASDPGGGVPRFGYFGVKQDWLRKDPSHHDIGKFLTQLLESAGRQATDVHAVVFPELALDYATFESLRDEIGAHHPTIELLVAGVSSDDKGRTGNFVAVATFNGDASPRVFRQSVRQKHHRWKLERAQLHDYGLHGVLSPELSWWEDIPLHDRKIDFTVLRRDSVLAAMICEDLARVDPCQQVIRAIGPNLVVALLMDAPQLSNRWPARYATVLAEDPGCAVLTLTSRALMTRQHRLGIHPSSGRDRIVGMWRDDRNEKPKELNCPYGAHAVLLTLVEEPTEDISLDGRCDAGAKAWRYVGHAPITIEKAREFGTLLGSEDLACW